jgi:hypothetical protein
MRLSMKYIWGAVAVIALTTTVSVWFRLTGKEVFNDAYKEASIQESVSEEKSDLAAEIDAIRDLIDTNEETSPLPKVETDHWRVYRNEENGFEVRLPDTWVAESWNEGIYFKEVGKTYRYEGEWPYAFHVRFSRLEDFQADRLRASIESSKQSYDVTVHRFKIDSQEALLVNKGCFGVEAISSQGDRGVVLGFDLCPDTYKDEFDIYKGVLQTFHFLN